MSILVPGRLGEFPLCTLHLRSKSGLDKSQRAENEKQM